MAWSSTRLGTPGILWVPKAAACIPEALVERPVCWRGQQWEAHRGLGHVLQGQLHEGLLPGLLRGLTGSNDSVQDVEEPEVVPGGDLWAAERIEAQDELGLIMRGVANGNIGRGRGRRPEGREHKWTLLAICPTTPS